MNNCDKINPAERKASSLRMPLRFMLPIGLLVLAGCGDFFSKKPTELESISVLTELQEVKDNKFTGNPMPELYLQPPQRVTIAGGVKLFYFTRHHSADDLAKIVTQQLGFKVVPNPSTNQLVVYCPDDPAADLTVEFLTSVDVPPIQVNIDCLILERFGDVTTDWETSILIENFLGENITFGESRATFDATGVLTELEPAFPGASLREEARSTFGLDFGYWINENTPGHQVRALVDILESRGYLKILLNPTVETINGKKATVTIQDFAPIEEIQTGQGGTSDLFSKTKYIWVADSLAITPYVFSDGFIGLTTQIKVGSRSKPEGVTQKAIITERSIDVAENRIKPGNSLIIGGMRKSERRSVVRGIPFFKDIPFIGVLFSSKDFEEKGTEIIFILTPTISAGGRPYDEVAAEVRKMHEGIKYKQDILGDPFGSGAYTELVEKETSLAEAEKTRTEAAAAQARQRTTAAQAATEKALAEVERLKAEAEKVRAETEKAKAETAKAMAEAEQAQKLTEAEAAKAAQALVEKQKALAEAQTARDAIEKAKAQTEEALANARQEEQKAAEALRQIEQAHQEEQKARQRITAAEKAKADAEAASAKAAVEKAQAEKEKAEAEKAAAEQYVPDTP